MTEAAVTCLGILAEKRTPIDQRAPLTPTDCADIQTQFPNTRIVVETSEDRIFTDDEYREAGIEVVEDLEACDIIIGLKGVPPQYLIPGKTYAFLSHTIKKQPRNREVLRQVIKRGIRLIDYECVRRSDGKRAFGSGRLAGTIGAYTGLLAYGRKLNLFEAKPAWQCENVDELLEEAASLDLPPMKIVLTGGGRVATGVQELFARIGIEHVASEVFLNEATDRPVFTQALACDYAKRQSDGGFDDAEYFMLPNLYTSDFMKYARHADMLITGHFWDPKSPRLFEIDDMLDHDFHLKVITDITLDIDGSVPCTMRDSRIESPVYDFNARMHAETAPYGEDTVSVVAVEGLASALPRDASTRFSEEMRQELIPALLGGEDDGRLVRATITEGGKLTANFSYLTDYVA